MVCVGMGGEIFEFSSFVFVRFFPFPFSSLPSRGPSVISFKGTQLLRFVFFSFSRNGYFMHVLLQDGEEGHLQKEGISITSIQPTRTYFFNLISILLIVMKAP